MKKSVALVLTLALGLGLAASAAMAQERIRLATTTSTENTGLLGVILPPFEQKAGVKVDVVAVGTGQALEIGKRCDADLLMVHAPELEEKYVAEGHGVDRRKLMYNSYFLVGPADDPAKAKSAPSAAQAMQLIMQAKAPFVSRGDKSGTHTKELELWKAAALKPDYPGYKEAGQGMGAVLTMAANLGAYTLTDSGTFYKMKSKGLALTILPIKDEALQNPYHVMLVNPAKCPNAKTDKARALIDFLVSPQGQTLIGDFKADGFQLFTPDARK